MSIVHESLDELRSKLAKNEEQLRDVNKLLASQSENETLLTLKRDLEQVITLTRNLVEMKESKVRAEASVESGRGKNKKKIPREWGEAKTEWQITERCQAKYFIPHANGRYKWDIAQIVDKVPHSSGQQGYKVVFLEYGNDAVLTAGDMRTYVPPLVDQIKIGQKVRACWPDDHMFYEARVDEITDDGKYKVTFLKYNNKSTIEINDIQILKEKKTLVSKDKQGYLHVKELEIPEAYQGKQTDSKTVKDKKRKKSRNLKKKHRLLKLEAAQQNRQNNWKRFMTKGIKKAKKKLGGSLMQTNKSMFAAPTSLDGRVGIVNSGSKMTDYHKQTHYHSLRRDPDDYSQLRL